MDIPKVVSYADDVACIIKSDKSNLQRIFNHYQDMTNTSGLNLNADKTEVITQRGNHEPMNILYNNLVHNITPCSYMKVNGLQLGFNIEETRNKNFNRVFQAVENQLRAWSKRYLSLLAKILIFKTYGLLQILFVASTSMLTKSQESQLNNLIYKFIWNKDMRTNKAPDR